MIQNMPPRPARYSEKAVYCIIIHIIKNVIIKISQDNMSLRMCDWYQIVPFVVGRGDVDEWNLDSPPPVSAR
jgi:hypothetical protein